MFIESILNTKFWFKLDHRHSVVPPGFDHPVHILPLPGEGVELQNVIVEGGGTAIERIEETA